MKGKVRSCFVDLFYKSGSQDFLVRSSGIIVDTPPGFATVSGPDKHKLLKACVDAFKSEWIDQTCLIIQLKCVSVNMILVIGHEKLTVDMQKLYGLDNEDMLILKVPKSGGVRPLLSHPSISHNAYR